MSEALTTEVGLAPDITHLITEDDTAVDNFGSEKQQRLLTTVLYSTPQILGAERAFLAAANVGVFWAVGSPPVVPDMFLSLDVQVPDNWWEKKNRSYLVWEFGKVPEVVIEIVSNKEGNELGSKLSIYERMRVSYYVVFDPSRQLGDEVLQIFELQGFRYVPLNGTWLRQVGLGLTLWQGVFEDKEEVWLRWCDADGNVLPTGAERATLAEEQLQETEQQLQETTEQLQETAALLEEEKRQKELAQRRAELLAEQLRQLGVDPDLLNG